METNLPLDLDDNMNSIDLIKSQFLATFKDEIELIRTELANCTSKRHCLIPACRSCCGKHRYIRANEIANEIARLRVRDLSPFLVTFTSPNWELILPYLHDRSQVKQFCARHGLTISETAEPLAELNKHAERIFTQVNANYYHSTLLVVRLLTKYEFRGRLQPEINFNYTRDGLKIKLHLHCVLGHRGKFSMQHKMFNTPPSSQRNNWIDPTAADTALQYAEYTNNHDLAERLSNTKSFTADRIHILCHLDELYEHITVHTEPIDNQKSDFERVGLYLTKMISSRDELFKRSLPVAPENNGGSNERLWDLPPGSIDELRQLNQLIYTSGLLHPIVLRKGPRCNEEVLGSYEFNGLYARRIAARSKHGRRTRIAFARMVKQLKSACDKLTFEEAGQVIASSIQLFAEPVNEQTYDHEVSAFVDLSTVVNAPEMSEPIRRSLNIFSTIYVLHRLLDASQIEGTSEDTAELLKILRRYDEYFPTMLPACALKRRFPLLNPGNCEENFLRSWLQLLTDVEATSEADRNRTFTYSGIKKRKYDRAYHGPSPIESPVVSGTSSDF